MILRKDYDELEAWIYRISGKHDFNTEVFKIGETEEGRNIVGLHVGDKNHSGDKPKVTIITFEIVLLTDKNLITVCNLQIKSYSLDFHRMWNSRSRMDCSSSMSPICS